MTLANNAGGSGTHLDPYILLAAGIATLVATVVTSGSIYLHLKNYRKPVLQRMVVRIMIMVPLYAISSLIALYSLEAAFVIDVLRDIYEAFVIYCFFHLLVAYLGGERSLLILLYGRPPKHHLFPVNIVKSEFDGSDPFTFLMLRRGIFQYVYVKPILAAVTLILKVSGVYNEGSLKATSGYLWISVIYNTSICISLYCLAMFWVCINDDVKPFRPMPKFLCIKGILFFSFWQSIVISILTNTGAIKQIGPYTDPEHIALAITDFLICFEMPFFAVAHTFAFSHTDYIDDNLQYAARMPMWYAIRDAFGYVDIYEDSRATLHGGVSYRKYEPVEGGMHQGYGRDRRIRAGLRYAKGGQQKYWLPMPEEDTQPTTGPISAIRNYIDEHREDEGYAPLLEEQEEHVFTEEPASPKVREPASDAFASATVGDTHPFTAPYVETPDAELQELAFHRPDEEEEEAYAESKKLLFGDYNYPCIDVSSERAKRTMWDEEERILSDRRAAAFSPIRTSEGIAGTPAAMMAAQRKSRGYGTAGMTPRAGNGSSSSDTKGKNRFWGEVGETDPSRDRPEDQPMRFNENSAIIDMAPDASKPELQVDGVQLGLTNKGRVVPKRQTSKKGEDGRYLSPSNHRPVPKKASSSSSNSSSHSPSSPAGPRPDAIDLVVEDPKAAEEEMANERRKGEPAVRQTGQRKVFKTAYVIEDDEGDDKEVQMTHEIEEGVQDPRRGENPEIDRTNVKVKDPSTGQQSEHDTELGRHTSHSEVQITRAATPPPHAIIEWNTTPYRSPPTVHSPSVNESLEDNPWA